MSTPTPVRKLNRVSLMSKFMQMNSLSLWENCDRKTFKTSNRIMEDIASKDLEVKLECIFGRMIRTRVSLLNRFTPQ